MKAAALWREAWRNITSGTTRVVLFATIAAVAGSLLVAAEVLTVRSILDDAKEYRDSGAATLILTAGGRVNGQACTALTQIDGVTAAGAIRESPQKLVLAALPGAPISAFEVTPGFAALLSPARLDGPGIAVSEQVASERGVSGGETLSFHDGGYAKVAGAFAYPSDGRRAGLGWAALEPTTGGERVRRVLGVGMATEPEPSWVAGSGADSENRHKRWGVDSTDQPAERQQGCDV